MFRKHVLLNAREKSYGIVGIITSINSVYHWYMDCWGYREGGLKHGIHLLPSCKFPSEDGQAQISMQGHRETLHRQICSLEYERGLAKCSGAHLDFQCLGN